MKLFDNVRTPPFEFKLGFNKCHGILFIGFLLTGCLNTPNKIQVNSTTDTSRYIFDNLSFNDKVGCHFFSARNSDTLEIDHFTVSHCLPEEVLKALKKDSSTSKVKEGIYKIEIASEKIVGVQKVNFCQYYAPSFQGRVLNASAESMGGYVEDIEENPNLDLNNHPLVSNPTTNNTFYFVEQGDLRLTYGNSGAPVIDYDARGNIGTVLGAVSGRDSNKDNGENKVVASCASE